MESSDVDSSNHLPDWCMAHGNLGLSDGHGGSRLGSTPSDVDGRVASVLGLLGRVAAG